uniref:Uncharacterized protein n=1 Tax=Arundo donax TaxID=35708 RepID=A0A0A9D858_ARUDO
MWTMRLTGHLSHYKLVSQLRSYWSELLSA